MKQKHINSAKIHESNELWKRAHNFLFVYCFVDSQDVRQLPNRSDQFDIICKQAKSTDCICANVCLFKTNASLYWFEEKKNNLL